VRPNMIPRWDQDGSRLPQEGFQRPHDVPEKVQGIFELPATWAQKRLTKAI
jgi:hypothetical protein